MFLVDVFLIVDGDCLVYVPILVHVASVYAGAEGVLLLDKGLKAKVIRTPKTEEVCYERFSTVVELDFIMG